MRVLRRLIRRARRAPGLVIALAVALLVAAVFALRLTHAALSWHEVPHEQSIERWMTPRFVVRSWDVPPDLVAATLALDRDGIGRRVTLQALADERGIPPERLIDALEAAIADYRTDQP